MRLKDLGPVSVSRLQKFQYCAWAFYNHYVNGEEESSTEPADFGKLVHYMVLQAIHLDTDLDEYQDDFIIHIMSGESNWARDENEPLEIARIWQECDRKEEALAMTQKAVLKWRELPKSEDTLLEQYFKVPLPDTDVEIQGYLDLLCGDQLWDWKTGHNLKSALQSMQLPIYAWGVSQVLNLDHEKFQRKYAFLAMEKVLFNDNKSIPAALEWAKSVVEKIDFAFETMEAFGLRAESCFPRSPGSFCRMCGYREKCMGITIPDQITSSKESREVALSILRMEEQLSKAKKVMQDYLQKNDPIYLNGEYFAMYPGKRMKDWNKEKLFELCQEHSIPWDSVFSVDSKRVAAIVKANPNLEQDINNLVTEKTGSPTFKHQQSPPKEKAS